MFTVLCHAIQTRSRVCPVSTPRLQIAYGLVECRLSRPPEFLPDSDFCRHHDRKPCHWWYNYTQHEGLSKNAYLDNESIPESQTVSLRKGSNGSNSSIAAERRKPVRSVPFYVLFTQQEPSSSIPQVLIYPQLIGGVQT